MTYRYQTYGCRYILLLCLNHNEKRFGRCVMVLSRNRKYMNLHIINTQRMHRRSQNVGISHRTDFINHNLTLHI